MKRLVALFLICALCLTFSMPVLAETSTAEASPDIPQTMTAYLYSNDGNTQVIYGELIEERVNLNNPSLITTTYAFAVTLHHSDTISSPDNGYSSTVYLTIDYNTRNTPTEYLLTAVAGHWVIHDSRVTVTSAELTYGCSGFLPFPVTQTETVSVANYFSCNTGFTSYILDYQASLGASLTLTYRMGSTRTWVFTLSNNLF